MSTIPTHAEIIRAADEVTEAMAARMVRRARTYGLRGTRGLRTGAGFWTAGRWADWQRMVPEVEAIRRDDPDAVEHAVVFLEADPWCFRSGYEKERVLLALRHAQPTSTQQARLDDVVLRLVHTGRRELGAARRLVRLRHGAALRPALRELVTRSVDDVAIRALRVLLATRRPRLHGAAAARARKLLEDRADAMWRWSEDETRRAVAALWDSAWEASLIHEAATGTSGRALELLALAPEPRIPLADRPTLVRPIVRMLRSGDDTPLRLLAPARCDELSAALVELADHPRWGNRITTLIVDGPRQRR